MDKFNKKSYAPFLIRQISCALLIFGFQTISYAQSVNCDAVKTAANDARSKKINRIGTSQVNQSAANDASLQCLEALNSLLNSVIPSGSIDGINVPSLNSIVGWLAKKSCAVVLAEAKKVTQTVINGVTQPIEGLVTIANGGVRLVNGSISDSSGNKLPIGTPFEYIDINGKVMISTVQAYTNSQNIASQNPSPGSGSATIVNPSPVVTKSQPTQAARENTNDNSIWGQVSCALTGGSNCK